MRRTEKAAATSTVVTALLGAGMIAVAMVSGSVSLIAEKAFADFVRSH